MPEITRPTIRLSLLVTPPADAARDDHTLAARLDRLDGTMAKIRDLALSWASTRSASDMFEDFEARLIEAVRHVGCAGTEVMLACAEAKSHREHPCRFTIGDTEYRLSAPEPRSFNTWHGPVQPVVRSPHRRRRRVLPPRLRTGAAQRSHQPDVARGRSASRDTGELRRSQGGPRLVRPGAAVDGGPGAGRAGVRAPHRGLVRGRRSLKGTARSWWPSSTASASPRRGSRS